MRKWVAMVLLVLAWVLGGYLWLCGYRLTPYRAATAVGVSGKILRKAPVENRLALLIRTEQGGCYVSLVRRVGRRGASGDRLFGRMPFKALR